MEVPSDASCRLADSSQLLSQKPASAELHNKAEKRPVHIRHCWVRIVYTPLNHDQRDRTLDLSGITDGHQLLQKISDSYLIGRHDYFAVQRCDGFSAAEELETSLPHMDPFLEVLISSTVEALKISDAAVTAAELTAILDEIKGVLTSRAQLEFIGDSIQIIFQRETLQSASKLRVKLREVSRLPTDNSDQNSVASYHTALSNSTKSYYTAKSSLGNTKPLALPSHSAVARLTPWRRYLREHKLLPSTLDEQNWSGRGQHAEYARNEESSVPLQVEGHILGHSATAVVDVVRCKRIKLARKTIRCSYRTRREDVAKEVEHLQRINYAHIVRVIGTYVFENKKDLHILMYPVADYDLQAFMECRRDLTSLPKFFGCLASTLAYLHKNFIKHMDIKPKNLLVRYDRPNPMPKIYLADFGIARSYSSALDAETCSPTGFTPIYAAPEVVAQETRGFKADVFSLGCVFAEMLSAIAGSWDELNSVRERNCADSSFQANINSVVEHIKHLSFHWSCAFWMPPDEWISMLDVDPDKRPSSKELRAFFVRGMWGDNCCNADADSLEASYDMGDWTYWKEERKMANRGFQ